MHKDVQSVVESGGYMAMLSVQLARVGEVPLQVLFPPALTHMHGATNRCLHPVMSKIRWTYDSPLAAFITSVCGCAFWGRGENTRKANLAGHPLRDWASELHFFFPLGKHKVCFFVTLHLSLARLKLERRNRGQMKVLMRNCVKALSLVFQRSPMVMNWKRIIEASFFLL